MALLLLGRKKKKDDEYPDNKRTSLVQDKIAEALAILVSKKVVEEEKVYSFNIPFFAPSEEEVESAVIAEGSFAIDQLEVRELATVGAGWSGDTAAAARWVRAIYESLVVAHFGSGISDKLFDTLAGLLAAAIAGGETGRGGNMVLVLTKKKKIGLFK